MAQKKNLLSGKEVRAKSQSKKGTRKSGAKKASTKKATVGKRNGRAKRHSSSKGALLKLDLGCGQHAREGFEGVDGFADGVPWKLNLLEFPWPWEDESVAELHSSHFLEHIPAECDDQGRDLLVRFMDEAWRVLKPGGKFTVIVPNARSNRAFQDPTHRRFFVSETFLYFDANWRRLNGLDHYLGTCHFESDIALSCSSAMSNLTEEERTRRFESHWNAIYDWRVVLTKRALPRARK